MNCFASSHHLKTHFYIAGKYLCVRCNDSVRRTRQKPFVLPGRDWGIKTEASQDFQPQPKLSLSRGSSWSHPDPGQCAVQGWEDVRGTCCHPEPGGWELPGKVTTGWCGETPTTMRMRRRRICIFFYIFAFSRSKTDGHLKMQVPWWSTSGSWTSTFSKPF